MCDASNKVRIGNSLVTSIEGRVNFSTPSDARLKSNIEDSPLGLDFILKLRPVHYHLNSDNSGKLYTGFIAQEVEKVVDELGLSFSAVVAPEDKEDFYSLRYAEFTVPLVNALQEQQKLIEEQKALIVDQVRELASLRSEFNDLNASVNHLKTMQDHTQAGQVPGKVKP
jgi:hypothetical protein